MNNQFEHFLQRAKERYDLDLTLQDLYDIACKIKLGKAKLTRANSRGFTYRVRFKSQLLTVVLNRSHSSFITALPSKDYIEHVRFNGKIFSYEDALYINWLFDKNIKRDSKNRHYCTKCGSLDIIYDLSKNRFRCDGCGHVIKIKKLKLQNPEVLTIVNNKYQKSIILSMSLWWFLYKTKTSYDIENLTITPTLTDNDKFEYIINMENRQCIVQNDCYTIQELKEMLNE